MSKLALGIIETIGLAAAVEAGDTAVKSANVNLIGYELSKGGGMVTVKIEGYVGAVKAAVEAGVMAAEKVSKVWSKQVIPRPHSDLEKMIITEETVGLLKEKEEESKEANSIEKQQEAEKAENIEETQIQEESESKEIVKDEAIEATDDSEAIKKPILEEQSKEKAVSEAVVIKLENESIEKEHKKPTEICNLCGDPKCPRKKGEPRKLCINYEQEKRRTSQ
ncbi:BMC domain-containing protein [Wukongibacter baidiensis]